MYIATYHLGAAPRQTLCSQPRLAPAERDCPAPPTETPAVGGWFGSSLDLLRGLEVRDLGPADWLDTIEAALAAA